MRHPLGLGQQPVHETLGVRARRLVRGVDKIKRKVRFQGHVNGPHQFPPFDKIIGALPRLKADLAPGAWQAAAKAMMTTDTVHKVAGRTVELSVGAVQITGMAKGAAMIGPNMATMLAIIMTDAALSPKNADEMLRHAVNRSFNCISVEGHTSTSDTVILLANGAAQSRGVSPRSCSVLFLSSCS